MISMAKTSQPNTARSQFFLMPDDIDFRVAGRRPHRVR